MVIMANDSNVQRRLFMRPSRSGRKLYARVDLRRTTKLCQRDRSTHGPGNVALCSFDHVAAPDVVPAEN